MTTETRKLSRSRKDRMVAGVCGGLGEYFSIDSTIVRLAFVAGTLLGGPGLVAYFICLILMPLEPEFTATPEIPESPEEA